MTERSADIKDKMRFGNGDNAVSRVSARIETSNDGDAAVSAGRDHAPIQPIPAAMITRRR